MRVTTDDTDVVKRVAGSWSGVLWIAALTAIGTALRIGTAYHGGIWADEGFLVLLVASPSWSGMLDFLRFHESHPPLFYAIMRLWRLITGEGDTAALVLPIFIGAALVPVAYMVGRSLFSVRAGIIAAALVAVSPPLVEYSGQLRPYGLLPLLTLLSCHALVKGVQGSGWKRWASYSFVTLVLLYTHHWSWLVVLGQTFAVLAALFVQPRVERTRIIRGWTMAWIAILAGYLPWIGALAFQLSNAGHGPVVIEDVGQSLYLVLYALASGTEMLLLGTSPDRRISFAVILAIAAAAAGTMILRSRNPEGKRSGTSPASIATRIFLAVPAATIAAATALSAQTNLLLGRCLAMLTPLILILIARWFDQHWSAADTRRARLAASFVPLVLCVSILRHVALLSSTRSNAREVAREIRQSAEPGDLLLIAPEWYAASFNHYFKPSIEQIDFPHSGRSGLVDFARVWQRVSNPAALTVVRSRIADARRQGRRVWLVSGRPYLYAMDERDSAQLKTYRHAGLMSVLRTGQIRDALRRSYGEPDTTHFTGGGDTRYDELLPFLYTLAGSDSASGARSR